jgi:hypothetical protein
LRAATVRQLLSPFWRDLLAFSMVSKPVECEMASNRISGGSLAISTTRAEIKSCCRLAHNFICKGLIFPSPSRDYVVIRHARPAPVPLGAGYRAREGGHPGRWNYSIELQLDYGFRRNDGSFSQLRHSLSRERESIVKILVAFVSDRYYHQYIMSPVVLYPKLDME